MAYNTNKWVGLDASGAQYYLDDPMFSYLEANRWGLWLEGISWYADNGSGGSDQAACMAYNNSVVAPILATIQENYTIPVLIDAKGPNAFNDTYPTSFFTASFNEIIAYFESWRNGTLGNCVKGYWYEGGFPTWSQWLRSQTPGEIHWELTGELWNNYLTQQGQDNIGGVNHDVTMETRMGYCDWVGIEHWWIGGSDSTTMNIALAKWLGKNSTVPTEFDTQTQGGWPNEFHLWGYAWNGTDAQPTYLEQRRRAARYIAATIIALGRPYDGIIAEVAGDSDGTVPGQGETVDEIMWYQLEYIESLNFAAPAGRFTNIADMGVQYTPS